MSDAPAKRSATLHIETTEGSNKVEMWMSFDGGINAEHPALAHQLAAEAYAAITKRCGGTPVMTSTRKH